MKRGKTENLADILNQLLENTQLERGLLERQVVRIVYQTLGQLGTKYLRKVELKNGVLIGGDLSFNHADNNTLSESRKESYMTDGNNFTNYDNQTQLAQNYDVNARLETEIQINPNNKIIIRPEISYRHNTTLHQNNYTCNDH
mgnify:CR=1 FL=1